MTLIFFGSDDFAAVNLNGLLAAGFEVVACVTQPDRPQGRGLKVLFSPVKEIASRHKISVFQPENLKDKKFLDGLKAFDSDLFIVIAYGKILPAAVLQIPRLFAVNVHGSLLPKYRGAAPINWAMINGDQETGISIIKMNARMDAGEIIAQERILIRDDDTSATLRARMADLSSRCLCRVIPLLEKGTLSFTRQDEQYVTFAPKLTRDLGKIDWQKPAAQIHNLVRGMLSWSAAYTFFKGKMLKVLETSVVAANISAQPGEVVSVSKDGILVAAGLGRLLLKTVHPESGKPMPAQNFAAGHQVKIGERFEICPQSDFRTFPDPRTVNIFLDSCAFDPKYEPENSSAETLFQRSEKSDLTLHIAHSTQKEIEHPNTPTWVKGKTREFICTIKTPLEEREQKLRSRILEILVGSGKAENMLQDAHHIFEAAKYGTYFVTVDERILRKKGVLDAECRAYGHVLYIVKPSKLVEILQNYERT